MTRLCFTDRWDGRLARCALRENGRDGRSTVSFRSPHGARSIRRTEPRDGSARDRRGAFTLVELLVVIAIIAVLLGILLPVIGGVRNAARKASTQSLMRDVRVAIDAFVADAGRMPGHFSPQEMGNRRNGDLTPSPQHVGFTAMENALLELAFPRVTTAAESVLPAPDLDNTIIDVDPTNPMPGANSTTAVRVDIASAGDTREGAYLSLSGDHLRPIQGQASIIDMNKRQSSERYIAMPDVVDYFGQPVMLWVRDASANLPPSGYPGNEDPTAGDLFASIFFDPNNIEETRASFYWASNAGYLRAGDPDLNPYDGGNSDFQNRTAGLGDDRIAHIARSSLGGANNASTGPAQLTGGTSLTPGTSNWIRASMMGVLGHPSFGTQATSMQLPLPTTARGDAILVSAGADRVFFSRRFESNGEALNQVFANVVGYLPREDAKQAGASGSGIDDTLLQTPEDFDDLIEATGG